LPRIKHLYPGGNTCYGFYSFYDYLAQSEVKRKIVLKGGPGTGKSTFMYKIGKEFAAQGFEIEYHWCSSDSNSLDGVVIGNHQVCILDGTAPHVVDPRFPGAVDEIINLGEFWNEETIQRNRTEVVFYTEKISRYFERAYMRLKEASIAYTEWKSYFQEISNIGAVNRNIVALTADFLNNSKATDRKPRHLFAGAITPEGIVTRVDSLLDASFSLFAVKGSPGSGSKKLLQNVLYNIDLNNVYAEVYHNPFDPEEIDIILLPESKSVLVDVSSTIVNYAEKLPSNKYKRILDFDKFANKSDLDSYAKLIFMAKDRVDTGISDAVSFIKTAKNLHDKLETYYIPAMNFAAIDKYRETLGQKIAADLNR